MNPAAMKAASATDVLTDRVRATWMAGDFGRIAMSYETGAAEFVQRLGIAAGERVLDVACGTGNLALPAARAGAVVSGIDIAPNLLDQLAVRAGAEGLAVTTTEGNCEATPYPDGSFDTVLSMFGVMFAARPEPAADELLRVCRRGGRIVLANWTPTGFIGQMFRTVAQYVAPPADVPSPLEWGVEERVRARLGRDAFLRFERRMITFRFDAPPANVVDEFRTWYGPARRAFDALDDARRSALRHDLATLWARHNAARDGTTLVESEYLEVMAVRH